MINEERASRGGFIVELDLNSFVFIPFIFNPNTLDEEDSPNYAITEIPGSPDPWVQYVCGKGLFVSCTIVVEKFRIDEMGLFVNQNLFQRDVRANLAGSKFSGVRLSDADLSQLGIFFPDSAPLYIEQIRKLIFPRQSVTAGFSKSPPKVTFLFGDSTFVGRVLDFSVKKTWTDSDLNTESAEISVKLVRDNQRFKRFFSKLPMSINSIAYPFNTDGLNQQTRSLLQKEYINR